MTALAARAHGVKFMVAAPTSTVDVSTPTGAAIPIESRAEQEVLQYGGLAVTPAGARAWNPAFDITPAEFVDALVTEKGVIERPTLGKIAQLMRS